MKKRVSTVILLFILLFVFTGFQFAPSALANFIPPPLPTVDICIQPDGSIEPSDVPIRREGNIYVFTGDLLNHTLTIECDHIVIDGAGFTLNKDRRNTELFLEARTNVTVINLCVDGVYVHFSTNNVLAKNTINSVILDYSSSNEITGNIIGSVQINSGSDYNIVVRNEIVSGVTIKDGKYTTVSENRFTNCLTSVFVYSCHNIISKNNILNEKNHGTIVITSGGSYNTVFGNNITTPYANGIAITDGCNNVVYENNLINCSIGVSLGSSDRRQVVANNAIYRNNFVNNTNDVGIGYVESSNVFDNNSEGNYWSRYNGTDTNADGIGDTPYLVHANFTDNYPMMDLCVLTRDITPPLVVTSPQNCTYKTNEIVLSLSSNETLTWTAYSLDEKDMVEITEQITLTGLSDGSHSITFYAKDTAGNMLSSKTINFQIDANQNAPLYVAAVVVSVAACILVASFVNLRKRKPEQSNHVPFSKVFLFAVLLVVCFAAVSIPRIKPVKADDLLYIRSDGSVEGTDTLQIDGNLYVFTADVFGSFVVEKDNIVIDGAGFTLQGSGVDSSKGVYAEHRSNITVKNLQIKNFGYGVHFFGCSNSTVVGNVVEDVYTEGSHGIQFAVLLERSSNNTVTKNNLTNNDLGVAVKESDNNTISENVITNNFRGLDLVASENNIVYNNYVADNSDGVALENMHNSLIGNTVTNNSNTGILLYGAGLNSIIENHIAFNEQGLVVTNCWQNTIYGNNFVNNSVQVDIDDSDNIWDNGNKGNYWSDYTGADTNADGTGDTPYVINENNQDNYPTMNELVIPEFPSLIILLLLVTAIATIVIKQKLTKKLSIFDS
ncbi:MAG: right-handed parallel beta-helix repeat-containing protein [Candidatus Bathyarchaeota archaeon]|nr:right-handed parallel beta-helix repeat-containing protein [Candidatus Bathyarchaeota archaeon]